MGRGRGRGKSFGGMNVVVFERLQRMIVMDKEIVRLMCSRLSTYKALYCKRENLMI